MGSKTLLGGGNGNTPHKRKRDSDVVEDTTTSDYFFAKYLTSAELLDLEVRFILRACRNRFIDIDWILRLPIHTFVGSSYSNSSSYCSIFSLSQKLLKRRGYLRAIDHSRWILPLSLLRRSGCRTLLSKPQKSCDRLPRMGVPLRKLSRLFSSGKKTGFAGRTTSAPRLTENRGRKISRTRMV